MTSEEIREKCGLIPWDKQHARMAKQYPDVYRVEPRGSGRTMRMLCDAVAAASEGKTVLIVMGSDLEAELEQGNARRIAERVGVPSDGIAVTSLALFEEGRVKAGYAIVLEDHDARREPIRVEVRGGAPA